VEGADAVQLVDLVIDRWTIAVAFLGHDMDDDGLAQLLSAVEHFFERGFVVPVDDARVLDAQALEHGGRLQQLLEAFLDSKRDVVAWLFSTRSCSLSMRDG